MKQLLTFFALAFLISWIICLPLYGHIFGLSNLPALPFQHAIGVPGSFIVSFLTNSGHYIICCSKPFKNFAHICFTQKNSLSIYWSFYLFEDMSSAWSFSIYLACALIIWIKVDNLCTGSWLVSNFLYAIFCSINFCCTAAIC